MDALNDPWSRKYRLGTEPRLGTSNFRVFAFPQGAAVDSMRGRAYFANRPTGGSDEDLTPSPFNGKVSVWDTSLRSTNCSWLFCLPPTNCPPPGYIDPRPANPTESITGLAWVSDVAVDEPRGLLYVSEGMACKIHVYFVGGISPNPTPLHLYSFGSPGHGPAQFWFVKGIDVDQYGNVYAVDCGNHRIQKWTYDPQTNRVDGNLPQTWGSAGRGDSQFINPVGLDVDTSVDNVYVSDPVNRRVQVFSTNGTYKFQFTRFQTSTGLLNLSQSVGVGSDDSGMFFLGLNDELARFLALPE